MPSFFPDCPPNFLLPDSKSLLVTGPFHASAPVHFAYSSRSENRDARIVLIASSQSALQRSLKDFDDEWLSAHSATGQFMDWASDVKILYMIYLLTCAITMLMEFSGSYPPSAAHLCLLLSMFHTLKGNEIPEEEWLVKNLQSLEPPSLIILCEPSSYFVSSSIDGVESLTTPMLPAYINLVSRAITLTSNLADTSGSFPKLVLFDSRVSTLKLPVTDRPSVLFRNPNDATQRQSLQQVLPLLQHFFEHVAIFEQDQLDASFIPSSQGEEDELDDLPKKRLKVYRFQNVDDITELTWREERKMTSTRNQTFFNWKM
ncbi:hypothetical protein CVT24_009599 [Panaeolus cyanescens]|uniref:Uncharacterized protein n=1 Tax=Panaeolus cyanescens TaxID=181874 RepID=A0A409YA87_9AGAR|nr:hypothetical protein CVT24_009599 [Panaeolus cyanescens]